MEKPLFEMTTKITRESCKAVARARAGQHNRVIWLINVLIALGVVVLWAIRSSHAYWLTAVLAFLVAQSLLRVPLAGTRLRSAKSEDHEIHLAFDDSGIAVRTKVEESRIGYDAVTGLRGDDSRVVLLLRHHTPLCVSRGECADFGKFSAFLKEKTGLDIRPLRR